MAVGRGLTGDRFSAGGFSLAAPPFVTHSRPIFLRVLDGAGDSELRVFRRVSAIKK